MVCTQVSCVLAPYQSHAQAPAVCEASPTEGDGPDVRRERLLFNRRYSTMMQKKDGLRLKSSAIPVGRWLCRKDCPFSFGYFSFWASEKKSNNARLLN